MSLANPSAQWEVTSDAAVAIRGLTFFVDDSGNVFGTTDPADAVGHVIGSFVEPDGAWSSVFSPVFGDGTLSAMRTGLTPRSLFAYD